MATPKTTTYSWLVLLIVIVGVVAFVLGICVPKWGNIKVSKETREKALLRLEQKKNTLKMIERVKEEYDANLAKVRRLEMALPSEEDIPGLIVQVRDMAIEAGVGVESAVFKEAKEIKEKESRETTSSPMSGAIGTSSGASSVTPETQALVLPEESFALKEVPISISTAGGYENLKRFLDVLGDNIRLLDISSMSLSQEEGGSFKMDLSVKAYILER